MSTVLEITKTVREEIVTRFNAILGEFVRKLILTYPGDELALKTVYNKLLLAMSASKSIVISKYIEFGHQYHALIEARDDSLFLEHAASIPVFDGVDMKENWNVTPVDTKIAIWSYMETLHRLSTSYERVDYKGDVDVITESMNKMASLSSDMLDDFKSKHNRAPTENDDVSEYSVEVADRLGLDLSCLADLDVSAIENQIDGMELPGELGKQMTKQGTKKMTKFVVQQLQNLKNRQARHAKINKARHTNVDRDESNCKWVDSVGMGLIKNITCEHK